MKKSIILALVSLVSAFGFISCDSNSTEGLTGVTYYAAITLEGETTLVLDLGSEFVDPGYSATLDGIDITDQLIVNSNVDMTTGGIYTVSYSYTNSDGFSSSASRTIYVCAPNGTLGDAAYYSVKDGSYREYYNSDGSVYATTPYSGTSIFFLHLGDDVYSVSCLIGAYYEQYIGYGTSYSMAGYITLNADNTIDLGSAYVSGWGDSYDSYANAYYDPATGEIHWDVSYAGCMTFFVTME